MKIKIGKKKFDFFMIVAFILLIILIVSVATKGFSFDKNESISENEAKEKAEDFVNNYLVTSGATVIVNNINEEGSLYLLNVTASLNQVDQNINFFLTKDGRFLVIQGLGLFDLDNLPNLPLTLEANPNINQT